MGQLWDRRVIYCNSNGLVIVVYFHFLDLYNNISFTFGLFNKAHCHAFHIYLLSFLGNSYCHFLNAQLIAIDM